MSDQAEKLRRLSKAATSSRAVSLRHCRWLLLLVARNGVGATTVAVNLAAAIADRGERVLVVDAAEGGNELADMAGVAAECRTLCRGHREREVRRAGCDCRWAGGVAMCWRIVVAQFAA